MTDPSRSLPLTRPSVAAAHDAIKSHIHRTPVLTSSSLNAIVSTPQSHESLVGTPWHGCDAPSRPKINLFFKCENFQKIGAFKIRGASHALSRLSEEELAKGVVTHSSGNHAQALALAATRFQTTAHIVMPTISTPSKIAATKGYGANVYFSGSTSDEREAVVREVMAKTGAVLVPPYDHPDIILGQGTMALELEAQVREMVEGEPGLSVHRGGSGEQDGLSDGAGDGGDAGERADGHHFLDAVIAPLGGGGMLAGVATALYGTPTRVYGAEPSFQGADDGRRGLEAGKRVTKVSTLTIADGLRTPLGEIIWTIISDKEKVRGVFAVTEEQIKKAMKLVLERLKVFVEPSACVGLAVVMFDEGFRRECEKEGGLKGWDVGIILSGGNVSVEGVAEIFKSEGKGRLGDGQQTNGEREEGVVGLDGARKAENVAG